MGDIKLIVKTALVGAAMGSAVGRFMEEIFSKDDKHRKWYDFWNNIFVFPSEYTDLIDMLLKSDKKSVLGTRIVKQDGQYIPGIGNHKLYWKHSGTVDCWNYIVFEKIDNEDMYYVCYTTNRQMVVFEDAVRRLFEPAKDMIRTISIESSRGHPFPMFLDKSISDNEKPHQTEAIDYILNGWFNGKVPNNNRKIMLCGRRGSGKSYIARLLSKRMSNTSSSITVRLYDDFNPSVPGASVALLVLQYAKQCTPIVLLIDEIDKEFDIAIDGTHADRMNVLVHTRNVSSLNKMLDMIGDTKNIITIYTTEKSPEKLYKNKKYHSFMRKGRIDMFINFTPQNGEYICEKFEHTDITGYNDMDDSDSDISDVPETPKLEKIMDFD